MSFLDDCYEDMVIQQAFEEKTIEVCSGRYSSQKIVNDAIASFREKPVDESSKLESVSRNILITIARIKRISSKQQNVLVRLLVRREEKGYEQVGRL